MTLSDTLTDGALIRAHLAGDPHAFGELAGRHQSVMWSIALGSLRSYHDAADAVQDALISAHQNAHRCRTEDSARGWLAKIVLNACRDRYRRTQARPDTPVTDEIIERLPTPRDPIADHERNLDLWSAMDLLPAHQRVVIVLVDIHGYPVQEVADMLGVPVGTVKSRCSRARRQLAEVLAPEGQA
ncbi:RNA polymerase sigma factor SigM [Pseudonocardia spinosispora]|uniref:RNA polymerase sigma factor SigM n=1 Tax=Pseudonocardia spinosispora TaxID=103441 RepID=UPI00040BC35D|nr:RNA polymerase sigma factor SigM [Pseudonocardia spinosispora]